MAATIGDGRGRRDVRHHTVMYDLPQVSPDRFVPKGAIAFFATMIVFYAVVWILLMAVMVARG